MLANLRTRYDATVDTIRPWWVIALQWGLWALAMLAMFALVARSRANPPATTAEGVVLRATPVMGWAGLIGAVFLAVLAVWSVLAPARNQWVAVVFVAFAMASATTALSYAYVRHVVTPTGLRFRTFSAGSGFLPWRDVSAVTYQPLTSWYALESAERRTVRVSTLVRGLPAFARAVLDSAPPEALLSDVRARLTEIVGGSGEGRTRRR